MKPKLNHKGDKNVSQGIDQCQTPSYAVEVLLPYLSKEWVIWESAAGNRNIVRYLTSQGYTNIIDTDILDTDYYNFFTFTPKFHVQITNPPYSIKYDWLERSLELYTPFALLVPVEMIAAKKTDTLRRKYLGDDKEFEYIIPNQRIDFTMPNKGDNGSAQFPTMWLCYGLNIGRTITRVIMNKPKKARKKAQDASSN